MNEINFLPQTYVKVQSRQRRVYREAVLVAITMVSIGGWYMSSRGSLTDVEAYAATVDNEAAVLQKQLTEMVRLGGERRTLAAKVELKRELEAPLETSTIIATIGSLMPPSIAMRSITLEGTKPTAAPAASRVTATTPQGAAPKAASAEKLSVTLTGLAPTDSAVTEFVGQLSSHGLFERIKLLYSRSVTVNDILAREFRIEMTIPFDRDYQSGDRMEGVANAR